MEEPGVFTCCRCVPPYLFCICVFGINSKRQRKCLRLYVNLFPSFSCFPGASLLRAYTACSCFDLQLVFVSVYQLIGTKKLHQMLELIFAYIYYKLLIVYRSYLINFITISTYFINLHSRTIRGKQHCHIVLRVHIRNNVINSCISFGYKFSVLLVEVI